MDNIVLPRRRGRSSHNGMPGATANARWLGGAALPTTASSMRLIRHARSSLMELLSNVASDTKGFAGHCFNQLTQVQLCTKASALPLWYNL
jgi:hypothetical protein